MDQNQKVQASDSVRGNELHCRHILSQMVATRGAPGGYPGASLSPCGDVMNPGDHPLSPAPDHISGANVCAAT
eukprot:867788-Pelagomonas_calceolata.AAC.2